MRAGGLAGPVSDVPDSRAPRLPVGGDTHRMMQGRFDSLRGNSHRPRQPAPLTVGVDADPGDLAMEGRSWRVCPSQPRHTNVGLVVCGQPAFGDDPPPYLDSLTVVEAWNLDYLQTPKQPQAVTSLLCAPGPHSIRRRAGSQLRPDRSPIDHHRPDMA